MTNIRYDLIGAGLSGIRTHPKIYIENLGFKVSLFCGYPLGDFVEMRIDGDIKETSFIKIVDKLINESPTLSDQMNP